MTATDDRARAIDDRVQTETHGDDVVVASVTVDAPRSVVFTAFTDPEVLARWFWPERFGTRIETDPRPGGAFSIRADGLPAGQQMGVTGTYGAVESPVRLEMSWQWTGEDAVSHVIIELSELTETRTRVVVTHSANPSTADRDGHLSGWRDCLGRLVAAHDGRVGDPLAQVPLNG